MKVLVVLAVCFCYSLLSASAQDCGDAEKALKKVLNGMLESGEHECATKFELSRFECTGGEDPDEDKKKAKEFEEYLGTLGKEDHDAVVECIGGMFSEAVEKAELSEECKQKIITEMKAMTEKQ